MRSKPAQQNIVPALISYLIAQKDSGKREQTIRQEVRIIAFYVRTVLEDGELRH